jgi:hypothetical protein
MLPHGYEGQGPEHSSARLERFMQLAADTNMQIVQPTTASQIFHVLRRQMVRDLRKPLIIFTPKSLLRNKDATSPVSEFVKGSFQTIIPENKAIKADKVKRILVCSGKVYYDLVKKREENGADDVAILRVEQLYPFPHKAFAAELKKISQRHRFGLDTRRTPKPRSLVLCAALHPRKHERRSASWLLRSCRVCIACCGLLAPAPRTAKSFGRWRVRQDQGLCAQQINIRNITKDLYGHR